MILKWPTTVGFACLDLFTDGTCLFPKEPKLRFAAWAVTWASAGTNSLDHCVLSAGHLSGVHQSSYRAELVALLVALKISLESKTRVRIWCDCQSVVNTFRFLQSGGCVLNNQAHSDLWAEVSRCLQLIPEGNVLVGKVVSHGSQQAALTDLESWVFWHNQLADSAAASYNVKRTSEFWQIWGQLVRELFLLRAVQSDICRLIVRIGLKRRGFSGSKQSASVVRNEVETGGPDSRVESSGVAVQHWTFTAALV